MLSPPIPDDADVHTRALARARLEYPHARRQIAEMFELRRWNRRWNRAFPETTTRELARAVAEVDRVEGTSA